MRAYQAERDLPCAGKGDEQELANLILAHLRLLRGRRKDVTMERIGDEIHVSSEEASGGVKNHGVRYVLLISLLLAILALSAVWITGSLNSSPPDAKDTATAEEAALGGG